MAETYSTTGALRLTAIAKSQYTQRRAQNGTWTYTCRGCTRKHTSRQLVLASDSHLLFILRFAQDERAVSAHPHLTRERAFDRSIQFQRRHGGEAALHRKRRPMTQRVQIRGARAQSLPHAALIRIVGIDYRPRSRSEPKERKRVGGRRDRMRAVAKQEVAALALRRVDRPGYDADVAIQIERVPGSDQRSAFYRCFDDDRQPSQRRDEPISLWEGSAVGVRARWVL